MIKPLKRKGIFDWRGGEIKLKMDKFLVLLVGTKLKGEDDDHSNEEE